MKTQAPDNEIISIPMDAARVCDAIARIGYQAPAAVMDIVDNSVTAGARNIRIHFFLKEDHTLAAKNNIEKVAIVDDGLGMDETKIQKALTLGSPADYPKNSLSKYGMGLKSAGFSLGSRISILSKVAKKQTRVIYVDRGEIATKGEYHASAHAPSQEEVALLDQTARDSGTLVLISGCDRPGQDSAKRTIDKLTAEMGVTYCQFISKSTEPLSISIHVTGKPEVKIAAKDILFSADAYKTYDKDNYDCKRPVSVVDAEIPADAQNPEGEKIRVEVMLFPQNQMSLCPSFTAEERERIRSYEVTRANKGFFIYRNGRLIRWGDDLDGLVGKDEIIMRGRVSLTTAHDDSLHVDVSKQRLFMPEEVRAAIKALLIQPLRYVDEIALLCKDLLKQDEGQKFNEKNGQLAADDEDAPQNDEVKKEIKKRRNSVVEKTNETLKAAGELPPDSGEGAAPVTALPVFEKVRYSDKVASVHLWEMGDDKSEGVFVRINKNHSFYQTVLSNLDENSAERQAIEALIWCSAVGENKAITTLTQLDPSTVNEVVVKFKKSMAVTLDTWATSNQDLFHA